MITPHLAGQRTMPGSHKIEGIGAGFIPETLDLSVVDRVEQVDSAEAVGWARRLAREEGILCGISSGAAVAAALRLAALDESEGKVIVVVLPDPFGPIIPKKPPSSTVRFIPFRWNLLS